MDLNTWLAYIEKLNSKPMNLSLENIGRVAKAYHLNLFQCPVITIGGTNGKGSCVTFLENILLKAGYQVGAYTSPHLLHYNERIRINGQSISDESLCLAFHAVNLMRAKTPLSFFEFTTLAALYLFQQARLDCIILEVGLGGRLDAVNIVDADIAVIASIAIDHSEWLGHTREEIGREKAGIMRPECPVICGDEDIPTSVITYAKEINASLYHRGRDFNYQLNDKNWSWQGKELSLNNLPLVKLPIQNAVTVLMVIELIQRHFKSIDEVAIKSGLAEAFLPGRFQTIKTNNQVTVIYDVAHNPASAELLAQQLQANPHKIGKQIAVVGMLTDKDIPETLKPLVKWIDRWYIGSLMVPRGTKALVLGNALAAQGIRAYNCFDSVKDAYLQALANADKQDRIIVFGSFHTVASVLK